MKMERFSGLFILVCLFCAVIAYPSSNLDNDAEIVVVPLEAQNEKSNIGDQTKPDVNNFDGVISTDIHPSFFSIDSFNPYNWNFRFFDRFHDIIRQFREHAHSIWSEPPVANTDIISPDLKTNSTSRVEYIDGRKVVINETFYKKETEFGTSIYNVRLVDILPIGDDEITNKPNVENSEFDVEDFNEKTDNKQNVNGEIDRGSPEELDNNENDNEIIKDIDEVEVKPSSRLSDGTVDDITESKIQKNN